LNVSVEPISVDALLLRAQFPELTLRPGATLVARVAARAESHGVLVVAGLPLTAQLPDEVAAGDTLRLMVTEVSAEKIVLRLEPPPSAVALPPTATPPGGPELRVEERPRRRGGAGSDDASVALTFSSAALGRLVLRIDVGTGTVSVDVVAPAGRPYELADRHAGELRAVLERQLGGRAVVSVKPSREPVDFYA
jgi:hypothetical protein